MHGAGGERELACDILRAENAAARLAEHAPHALDQQSIAAVGQHGQPQRALEHAVEIGGAAGQRQREIMLVEDDAGAVRIEADVLAEDGRIDRDVSGLGIGKLRRTQRDRGIHRPAGEAEHVAEQGDEAELAQGAEIALLANGNGRGLAADGKLEQHVVRQQAMMPAPAL